MKYYYVLWMPTKHDGIPRILKEPFIHQFHDDWRYGGYYIDGKVDKEILDFTIYYKPHFMGIPFGKRRQVTFTCEDKNKKGFVLYSFDFDDNSTDPFCLALKGKMNPAIYHYIKTCFHKHEFHELSNDSLLSPYISSEKISLKDNENDIVQFYLNQYKNKFDDFLEDKKVHFKTAKQHINALFRVSNGIDTLASIITHGNSIKGEWQYFEYLKTHTAQQACISKEFRKSVNNTFDEIKAFLSEVSSAYNLCTSGLGVKYGRWGILFGVFGIIVSAIGVFYSLFSKPDFSSVNQHLDSVSISVQNRLIEEFKTNADTMQLHKDSSSVSNQKRQ